VLTEIDYQCRLFVQKVLSIEIKSEEGEGARVRVRKMKGKVTLAERPSQWKPLDVTKVPRMRIQRDDARHM